MDTIQKTHHQGNDKFGRLMWRADLDDDYRDRDNYVTPATESQANVIGSKCNDGLYRPVIDLDFPARLIPSRTPGHFHLMLDGIGLSEEKFTFLMNALAEVGILNQGIIKFQVDPVGDSFVRKPGIKKALADADLFQETYDDGGPCFPG